MRTWERPQGAPVVVVDRAGRSAWRHLRPLVPEPRAVCSSPDPWALGAYVRDAVTDGCEYFVCCGGDQAWLAVASGSAGCGGVVVGYGGGPASLPRNFGLAGVAERAAERLVAGGTVALDTMRVASAAAGPLEVANAIWWGFGRRAGLWAGPWGSWRAGFAVGATYLGREPIELRMGSVRRDYEASGLLVANGQFVGDCSIAPQAHPADGKLEVLVFDGPARDVWRMRPRLRHGTHLPHPRVRDLRPTRVEIDGRGRLFADGADIGRLPASVEALPGRLLLAT